jgi:hypothetical protein
VIKMAGNKPQPVEPVRREENPPAEVPPVAAQAQPMDQQLRGGGVTPEPDPERAVGGVYQISLDLPNVPKAGDVEVEPGQPDPSLVVIPGLGQFRNGTTRMIEGVQVELFRQHIGLTTSTEEQPQLPKGITIEKKGD